MCMGRKKEEDMRKTPRETVCVSEREREREEGEAEAEAEGEGKEGREVGREIGREKCTKTPI
jgi:hypothetical protein